MSIPLKSQCQWYPQLHCSFLICHLLLKLVSTPLGPDPQGGDGPKTKAAQLYALQPNTKSASNLIFTTFFWLTPLMSLEPLESKLNHSNQIWRTLISFEEFLSDLNHFYQIWKTMIRLEPLYRLMFIRLAFSTMAFLPRLDKLVSRELSLVPSFCSLRKNHSWKCKEYKHKAKN